MSKSISSPNRNKSRPYVFVPPLFLHFRLIPPNLIHITNRNRYSAGVPTFRYLYDGNFSDISPAPWQGAFHGSELPLIFGTYGVNDTLPPTAFEIAVSHRLQDLWLAFATDRVAGLQNMSWPEFKPNGMALHFANDSIVEQEIPIKTLTSVCNGVMGVLGASPPQ